MKIALITGAGSGIGKAAAIALAETGFAIVLAGRKKETLEVTAAEIATNSASTTLIAPTDVQDPESVRALLALVRETFGRLDVLFNNAGVNIPAIPLDEITYNQWRMVMDINLTGTFLCTQEAFKLMKTQVPQGGRIINNGSLSAHVPRPNSAPYTSSKHAVTGLTKSTNLDGRKYNIVCGQIDIGNATTDMAARMEKGVLQANGTTATEPTMDVDHVSKAIVYMATLPLEVNVPFLTVMANQMPFMGRG
ncbi:UNVERIFIED_CONTAM: hypothetical protein GTU68_021191 [Idotea baltica]|nr:hypothetical protein [Idotea baltica]